MMWPGGREFGFRARGEYLLDRAGYNHIGLIGEYRQGDYSFVLYLNIKQLYSRYDKRLIRVNASEVRVSLDSATVSATYTVTNGTQLTRVYRDSLTVVNLSLTPLISVVGHVVTVESKTPEPNAPDPNLPEVSAMVLDTTDANEAPIATKPL
ncbi:MAG: hypothetical protein ACM3VT_03160, partial [Solirubrobacterales bacterium]